MGVIVESNGETIWSPSSRVGYLFLEQIRSIERIAGCESGVEMTVADLIEIDAPVFDLFVKRVLHILEETNNGPLHTLAFGCTQVAVALNERITGTWPEVADHLQPLLAGAKTVMHALRSPTG